jgi:TfoX/Sxy family transcriptional regulator of competence genes
MAYDEKAAMRVRELLSSRADVIEKKMMGGLCFMVGGNMCCSVSGKGGILVRVGPDAHPSVLGEPHVQPMEMRGRMMTGFVRIAPEGYGTDAGLKKWIQRGLDFVASMLTKSSARKTSRSKAPKRQRRA